MCVLCVDSHPSEERPPPTEMLTVSPGSRVLSIAEKSVGPATEPRLRERASLRAMQAAERDAARQIVRRARAYTPAVDCVLLYFTYFKRQDFGAPTSATVVRRNPDFHTGFWGRVGRCRVPDSG